MADPLSNGPPLESVSKLELRASISKEAASTSIVTIEGANVVAPNSDPALVIPGLHNEALPHPPQEYRLYKRRFIGLFGVVVLNVVTSMARLWFAPISEASSKTFGLNLDQINWLANSGDVVYLIIAPFSPRIYRRLGIRWSCLLSGLLTLISSWIRVAGTAKSLSSTGSLALLIIAQMMVAGANVLVDVLGTKYSQTWFSTKGRTTATMVVAMAPSVGRALGSVISPAANSPRSSVLILAIIGSVGALAAPLVGDKPPTPPTYAAFAVEEHPMAFMDTIKALLGREPDKGKRSYMTVRQRIDFNIILTVGGTLVGIVQAFGTLSDEILSPYGYSSTVAGLCTAILLLVGLLSAIIITPLLDRVFKRQMTLVTKLLCPIVGLGWLSLIWAIRPHNTIALFVIMGVVGAAALPMLPIALELNVEMTKNAEGSSALFHITMALNTIILVQVSNAMRAGGNSHPPFNMHTSVISSGVLACVMSFAPLFVEGKQTRRQQDEDMGSQAQQ